ncbi:hypothetical protein KP762_06795, partial [Streptococcus equi subsp. equi]|nr:hypothetical protein [Streptococcus equi subsp. equi]
YLVERDLQSGLSMLTASSSWNDYSPQGNVLLVTPQYVKAPKVEVHLILVKKSISCPWRICPSFTRAFENTGCTVPIGL